MSGREVVDAAGIHHPYAVVESLADLRAGANAGILRCWSRWNRQVADFIDGCAGGEFAGGVGLAEVRAAVVRLSGQGVRKAVASGPEVLRRSR